MKIIAIGALLIATLTAVGKCADTQILPEGDYSGVIFDIARIGGSENPPNSDLEPIAFSLSAAGEIRLPSLSMNMSWVRDHWEGSTPEGYSATAYSREINGILVLSIVINRHGEPIKIRIAASRKSD